MDKINTYAELLALYPWLDEMLKDNPQQAALMIYTHGTCDIVREMWDRLGLARDVDDWQRAYVPTGVVRDS